MPLYKYVKSIPKFKKHRNPIFSYVLMILGVATIIWISGPILSFWIFTSPLLVKSITPLPDKLAVSNTIDPQVLSVNSVENADKEQDYTNPNIWYPAKPQKKIQSKLTTYTLSIPKLKIKDMVVTIGGDDLNKSLIHYGGTALPGEYGNAVIFGHSTLVQLFNPKNYRTIFSTLPTIKKGDSVYIKADGVQYRYVVYDLSVTEPGDLSPLEQQFDAGYITLITCVPPGTYLKRLNVKAKLEKI